METNKPTCFNRYGYRSEYQAQDGWNNIKIGTRIVRIPRMVTIKNVMSKECKQNEPLGAATVYGWNCEGCKHYGSQKG